MPLGETFYPKSREEWRDWLAKNHRRKREVWLVVKGWGKNASLPYTDRIGEAICFGWIDGILKLVGEKRYAVRFGPRRKRSRWSLPNRVLALKMVNEGKMTFAGLATLPRGVISVSKSRGLSKQTIDLALKVANVKRLKILHLLVAREMSLPELAKALLARVLSGLMRRHVKPLVEWGLIEQSDTDRGSGGKVFRITTLGMKMHDLLSKLAAQ